MAVPHTANHLQIISNAAAQFMGKTGSPTIYNGSTASPPAGSYCAIYFIADTVFSSLKFWEGGAAGIDAYVNNANAGNPVSAITFKANSWLFGNINDFTITSGTVILYKA
jgi:hypothetical protein